MLYDHTIDWRCPLHLPLFGVGCGDACVGGFLYRRKGLAHRALASSVRGSPGFGVCGRVQGEKAFRNDFRSDEFIVFGNVLGERTNSVADRITAARVTDGCDDS